MPINKINKPNSLEKDLLRAVYYILKKYEGDVKNTFNVVSVLKQYYDVDNLIAEIIMIANMLQGLQAPTCARVVSPSTYKPGLYTDTFMYGIRRYSNKTADIDTSDWSKEDKEIFKNHRGETKHLPPRMDLRKFQVEDDDLKKEKAASVVASVINDQHAVKTVFHEDEDAVKAVLSSLKTPSQNMTLKQLLKIQENNYLSADGKTEYVPEEIDSRIWELESKLSERLYDQEMRRQQDYDETA